MNSNRFFLTVASCSLTLFVSGGSDSAEPDRLRGLEPYIGEIMWVAFDFAPKGWIKCNGQVLPIESNQSLYSLLGTAYGGDGETTFALPDLRGRLPVHVSSSMRLGLSGGDETIDIGVDGLPSHSHGLHYNPNNSLGAPRSILLSDKAFTAKEALGTVDVIGTTGSSAGQDKLPPFTCINAVIAMEGTFPPRN